MTRRRMSSLSHLLMNPGYLASLPKNIKIWWCISTTNLEFDERRLVKETLLTYMVGHLLRVPWQEMSRPATTMQEPYMVWAPLAGALGWLLLCGWMVVCGC